MNSAPDVISILCGHCVRKGNGRAAALIARVRLSDGTVLVAGERLPRHFAQVGIDGHKFDVPLMKTRNELLPGTNGVPLDARNSRAPVTARRRSSVLQSQERQSAQCSWRHVHQVTRRQLLRAASAAHSEGSGEAVI